MIQYLQTCSEAKGGSDVVGCGASSVMHVGKRPVAQKNDSPRSSC